MKAFERSGYAIYFSAELIVTIRVWIYSAGDLFEIFALLHSHWQWSYTLQLLGGGGGGGRNILPITMF
jgi:hypothetical protein